MSDRFVVLSGCSGGGKSTLLAALAARGYRTVEEPGRRIVRAELEGDGRALPWVDLAGFARRAIAMALEDRAEVEKVLAGAGAGEGWTFFDRGLIDAASALQMATGEPALDAVAEHRYHRRVFLTPPWPEIHTADAERRHGFEDAIAEYEQLAAVYPALGYETILVPKRPVAERVEFILDALRG
jgi:predicted ATPase